MNNYIPDVNRFKLAGPPDWWLRQLWDFDSSLVVVPSRMGFFYRLAQRRKPQLSAKIVNEALWNESDTQMLARHHLVPVTTILATVDWSNPLMFEELRRRNVHRMGGAEKVIKDLEAAEAQEELKKRLNLDEHHTSLSKDAWKLYRKKIGLRTSMWSPTIKPKATGEAKPNRAPLIKIS